MLQFTDLNDILHVVHIRNVTHVQFRETQNNFVVSFHFIGGQYVVPATVNAETASLIAEKLGELS
ncbi:hypothetical protein HX112_03135 [Acinetobacter towneri]|uniref:hypothetical protein n=1 Tax=Acinetobacter towneri TaxID=202956 RepID=UPI0025760110|nr:hypothetical protein [Acinetobacter towneri]MDM1735567.1 hypothetical protein [Acinetobacter towneri]